MKQEGYVELKIKNNTGIITFFHPAHNSLPGHLLSELAQTIIKAGNNSEIKVIILQSGGDRTFCAGASFTELVEINDFATGKQFFMGFANVINACRKCPKIIIGRVQGKAVGGGVGLASAVDYCFATKFASVKLSELTIGIGPFVVGPAVQRKLGVSRFAQMSIDAGTFYSAEWALQSGLFHHVFEDSVAMDEAISSLVDQLVNASAEAQMEIKKITWEGTEHWDQLLEERAAISGRLVLSETTKKILEKYKTTS